MAETWVITLSGSQPIESVLETAKQAGLVIGHILPDIGVIVGDGSKEVASKLRHSKGVADVSPDQPIGIIPPGPDFG